MISNLLPEENADAVGMLIGLAFITVAFLIVFLVIKAYRAGVIEGEYIRSFGRVRRYAKESVSRDKYPLVYWLQLSISSFLGFFYF